MDLKKRIYEDYFKKSRLFEYEALLINLKNNGYRMVSIREYFELQKQSNFGDMKLYINRHDIDTSPRVAREMFDIEKKVFGKEGSATYYFRKSTLDKKLIHEIDEYGYETGFHYETLANYEKKHKLKNVDKIRASIPEMEKLFVEELTWFRNTTMSKSETVASHGDFINTRYGIQSVEILKNNELRKNAGIVLEAYDDEIEGTILGRVADQRTLEDFSRLVNEEIDKKTLRIITLTHPRNWKVDVLENTRDNFCRIIEDLAYRI